MPDSEGWVKPNKYKGDFALFTCNGDVKIFDVKNKVVLNFINRPELYTRLKLVYSTFSPFFNIPMVGFCDHQQMLIEDYIDFVESEFWTKRCKQGVFESYCTNFTKYVTCRIKQGYFTNVPAPELLKSFHANFTKGQSYMTVSKLFKKKRDKKMAPCGLPRWFVV